MQFQYQLKYNEDEIASYLAMTTVKRKFLVTGRSALLIIVVSLPCTNKTLFSFSYNLL